MDWLNENASALGIILTVLTIIGGWFTRLEVRLASKVSKDDMASALEKIYTVLRPMGENIARITGQLENRHD